MLELEIILTPNPLQRYVVMGEADKKQLHQLMYDDNLEWGYSSDEAKKWADYQLPHYIDAFTTKEEHCGDCTSVACACIKCQAESVAKLADIPFQANWHLIQSAFNGTEDILKAIEELAKPVVFTWDAPESTIAMWNHKQGLTRSALIDYYINYCCQ